MNGASEEYRELTALLRDLEQRVTQTLTQGLGAVNQAIAEIANSQHRALLAQSEKNATFADRDRVEHIAQNAHDVRNMIQIQETRMARVESRLEAVDARCAGTLELLNTRSLRLMSGATGYLVTGALLLGSNVITFLLAHAH